MVVWEPQAPRRGSTKLAWCGSDMVALIRWVIRTPVIAALFDDVVLILKLTDPEMKVLWRHS
jgi:hypothetical protein